MSERRATITDVAREAGVSASTASVVFSGKQSKKVNGLYKPESREILIHNRNFKGDNALVYTAIHEFAHHIQFTKGEGKVSIKAHTNVFWNIFHNLLVQAEDKGLYDNIFRSDPDFIALTKDRPLHVRFIEYMPMGESDHAELRVTGDELLAARPYLEPLPPLYQSQPARDYRLPGAVGRVGLINPVSHQFCSLCNRVRVMSDGVLRPCLGDNLEFSLKEALESGDDAALLERIRSAIWEKPETHGFGKPFCTARTMSRIGG